MLRSRNFSCVSVKKRKHMEKIKNERNLSCLRVGECGAVVKITSGINMRRRLLDVGMSPGTRILCVGKSPFGDPRAYLVRGCVIAIRNKDADSVIIE